MDDIYLPYCECTDTQIQSTHRTTTPKLRGICLERIQYKQKEIIFIWNYTTLFLKLINKLDCPLPLKASTSSCPHWPPDCRQRSMIAGCHIQGQRAFIQCILGSYRNELARLVWKVLLSDASQTAAANSSTFQIVVKTGERKGIFHPICPLVSRIKPAVQFGPSQSNEDREGWQWRTKT